MHPAASCGVRPVSEPSVRFQPTVQARPSNRPTPTEAHATLLLLCDSYPGSENHRQLSQQTKMPNRCSFPRAHPPFEAFPSDLAVPPSPSQMCVATPLNATVWSSPLVVTRCVRPPRSPGSVAESGFPQPLGHFIQPQGVEPSPSPLHSHTVSDVSMPVAPMGFSNVGSPTLWQCASESDCSDRNSVRRSNISA